MSDDNYSFDAFPDSIFDSIFLTNNLNMDVIFGELQDPSLIASIINDDDDDDYGIDVEMKDVLESDQPSYPIKNHDCMWSGTCDISHTSQYRLMLFWRSMSKIQIVIRVSP